MQDKFKEIPVNLYFLNPGDHPVNEETRKYKIQLLIYSSLAILFSFMGDKKIEMILGVKFTPQVEAIYIVPVFLILIFYHLFMFLIIYDSSSKAWELKKSKLKEKDERNKSPHEDKDKYTLSLIEKINSDSSPKISNLSEKYERLLKLFKDDRVFWDFEMIEQQIINLNMHKPTLSRDYVAKTSEALDSYFIELESSLNNIEDMRNKLIAYKDKILSTPKSELNSLRDDFECSFHDKLEIVNSLHRLKESLRSYKAHDFDIVKKADGLHSLYRLLKDKSENHEMSTSQLISLSNDIERNINIKLNSLAYEFDKISLKESFLKKELPYYYFPKYYSCFSIILSITFFYCHFNNQ